MKLKRTRHIGERHWFVFGLAKRFSSWGYHHRCHPHLEWDPGIDAARKQGGVFLYAALHKSLWETSGIQVPLLEKGFEVPWVGMGDNLVQGKFFRNIVKKTGAFIIRRARSRRDLMASARDLKDAVSTLFESGRSVLLFPEGTRRSIPVDRKYGVFFPTVFEAVLEYEKNIRSVDGSDSRPAFIVPVNVDYSKVREDREMIHRRGGPLTLHVLDSFKMLRHIGDTYISFGPPMRVTDLLHMKRRPLADAVRERCLELVKILPVNVLGHAVLRSSADGIIDRERIDSEIRLLLSRLTSSSDRFRGFTSDTSPEEIIKLAATADPHFLSFDDRLLPIYRMYADYISFLIPDGKETA